MFWLMASLKVNNNGFSYALLGSSKTRSPNLVALETPSPEVSDFWKICCDLFFH